MNYQKLKDTVDRLCCETAESIDYNMQDMWSIRIHEGTKYSGRGRPRDSDYDIWRHPRGNTYIMLNK
jgi:hypothetical protein